jgi:hypothetical protein
MPLIIFLFFFGCEDKSDTTAPPVYDYSVNCILYCGIEKQQIYFDGIGNYNEMTNLNSTFIPNAIIEVDDIVFSTIGKDTLGHSYYGNDKQCVLYPGKECKLTIQYNNNTISGITTIPDTFSILSPAKFSSVDLTSNNRKNVIVNWSRSKSAKGYLCQIIIRAEDFILNGIHYNYWGYINSIFTKDTIISVPISIPYGSFTIKVIAYDGNYSAYYIDNKYFAGVNGAYGVFGSAAIDTALIYIKQ